VLRPARRYATHLVVLLLIPLPPVAIYSYAGRLSDDCTNVRALLDHAGAPVQDEPRTSAWVNRHFNPVHWAEGSISQPGTAARLRTIIIRSHDAKRLYHRPEKHLFDDADSRDTEYLEVDGESLPIHRAHYTRADHADHAVVVAYLLVYDSRPVDNPYTAQFAALGKQIFRGRIPMTLFFVSGVGPHSEAGAMTELAKQWLAASWRQCKAACLSPVSASPAAVSDMRTTPKDGSGVGPER
jgi:hypothetical protein